MITARLTFTNSANNGVRFAAIWAFDDMRSFLLRFDGFFFKFKIIFLSNFSLGFHFFGKICIENFADAVAEFAGDEFDNT